ncbi:MULTISPECIES: hypothetical protein [unclassified Bradyrhizobium]|uniref:hypothetical protein n=1 Tax=unclassified Bradyrhizobium TaxID=2631580 RepID=UPI0012EB6B87|nr:MULTISPECIES: hypothetical protein [unclassified Bradyrhizobium]QIG91018.1 hypothetical protein G6P99_14790 [Bradyrhizobium sp. 6(2017)]
MNWKTCVTALPAIVPPRRAIATALVYGLSLGVRFTSATGEQVEVHSLATASIMTTDDTPTSDNGWHLGPAQPIALRLTQPPAAGRCHAGCGRTMPMASAPTCGAP